MPNPDTAAIEYIRIKGYLWSGCYQTVNTIAQNVLWISRILPGSPNWDGLNWGKLTFEIRSPPPTGGHRRPSTILNFWGQSQAPKVRGSAEITSSKPRLSIISLSYSGNGTLELFHVFETRWYYAFRYCCKQLLLRSRVAFRDGTPGS